MSWACCWPNGVRTGPGTFVSMLPETLPYDWPWRTNVTRMTSAALATGVARANARNAPTTLSRIVLSLERVCGTSETASRLRWIICFLAFHGVWVGAKAVRGGCGAGSLPIRGVVCASLDQPPSVIRVGRVDDWPDCRRSSWGLSDPLRWCRLGLRDALLKPVREMQQAHVRCRYQS